MAASYDYPSESLREELTRIIGLQRDEQERRKLRTMAYKMRIPCPEGATTDQLAQLVIDASTGREGPAA